MDGETRTRMGFVYDIHPLSPFFGLMFGCVSWQAVKMMRDRRVDGNLGGALVKWLVVDLPLWKMMEWKSVGMMTFPTEWKNNPNVPNHQPVMRRWEKTSKYATVRSCLWCHPCKCTRMVTTKNVRLWMYVYNIYIYSYYIYRYSCYIVKYIYIYSYYVYIYIVIIYI